MLYSNLPAIPVFGIRREIDRVFDDVFGRENGASAHWLPTADVREDDAAYTIELELPGMKPEQVEVTAEKGVLTVRGEKTASRTEGDNARWRLTERVHGTFKRAFQLPDEVDQDGIAATFTNGVLTLRVPKAAAAQPKRVVVKHQS